MISLSALNLLIFAAVVVNIVIGIVILVRNSKSVTNRFFALFALFLGLWIIANFLENEPNIVGLDNLELFLRLDFFFAILFFFAWFHFCVAFVKTTSGLKGLPLWATLLSIGVTSFFAVSAWVPGLLLSDIFFDGVILFTPSELILPYLITILFYSGIGLVVLFRGLRKAKKSKHALIRRQLSLVFWGFLISFLITHAVNFGQSFYPISLETSRLGLYALSIVTAFTAYAITQSKLFEIKFFIFRAVSFLILIVGIAAAYATVFFLAARTVFNVSITTPMIAGAVALTVIAMLTFQPLQRAVRYLTGSTLFKGVYDNSKLLSKLTHLMAETIDLDELTSRITKTLLKEMKVQKAAFLLVDKHKITDIRGVGYEGIRDELKTSELEALLHKNSKLNYKHFIFEELQEGDLKQLFRKLDILLATPVKVEENEIAILILGPKLSGESYYDRDINLIDVFASEAGIAIQNSQAYDRIKKFSEELEIKVEVRTKELKEAQISELAKAKDIAKLKDEFVFIAAHELRTPVTAIKGFLELVSPATAHFPKDVKENLSSISAASGHLNQLINDLLQIARSDAGTLKVVTKPTNIVAIINEVIKEVSPLAKKKKLKLEFSQKTDMPEVYADPARIKEVITNLVSNAIKYNRDGGDITVQTFPQDGTVFVEVRDTGFGIPKDQQEKIFSKFFRAASKETEEVLGTGLGLFIARMMVEKMGGQIQFSSIQGKGTTFAFTLPRVK